MLAKYPSLKEYFKTFKDALCDITCLVKKFRYQDINKGADSGFRLTFMYDKKERPIYFVEFYHKNKKKLKMKTE